MERIRVTILGLAGLITLWLFIYLPVDSAGRSFRPVKVDSGVWSAKAKMPEPRKFEAAFPINGKVYCVTSGDDSGRDGGRVYEYSPSTDTWAKRSSPKIARHSCGVAVLGTRIYAISGVRASDAPLCSSATPSVEEYNVQTDSWTPRAPLPRPRLFPVGAAVNEKLYAIGGMVQKGSQLVHCSFVDEYDPKTNRWTARRDLPQEMRAYRVGVLGGRIYVTGGADRNFSRLLATIYEYDPMADSWSEKAPMSTARADHAVTAHDGKLFVFGGLGAMNSVEEYDPSANQWRVCSNLPLPNWLEVAASTGSRIYVISGWEGGWPGGSVHNSVLEYDPRLDR